MPMKRKLWTISGLAVELDRDRRTIAAGLKAAPPDGKSGVYDAWLLTTALAALQPPPASDVVLDPAQERARKDRALAIAAEIKNDVAAGEVVPIEAVIGEVTSQLAMVRTKLLAIPSQVAGRLPGRDRAVVQELMSEVVRAALVELSGGPDDLPTVKRARKAQARAMARKEPAHA